MIYLPASKGANRRSQHRDKDIHQENCQIAVREDGPRPSTGLANRTRSKIYPQKIRKCIISLVYDSCTRIIGLRTWVSVFLSVVILRHLKATVLTTLLDKHMDKREI
jgi:hypothetical protein